MAVCLALLALAMPGAALAQVALEPTAMSIGAPSGARLGEKVTLQARLVDSSGAPMPEAKVVFVRPSAEFLSATDDVVIADAVTDKQGLAVATYEVRSSGQLPISAEFQGDERHAASKADAQMSVGGAAQPLYVQQAGVRIPILNSAPPMGPTMGSEEQPLFGLLSVISGLWPRLSFWPIAAVLLVVWSLYASVVRLLFRIARDPSEAASRQPGHVFTGFGDPASELPSGTADPNRVGE